MKKNLIHFYCRCRMNKLKLFFNNIDWKKALKRYLIFFIPLMFLECFFKFIIFHQFDIQSIINILLFVSIISSFISFITGIFSKGDNAIILTIFFIVGVLFIIQIVFYNTFKTFYTFSILGLSDQLESYMSETFSAIIENIWYIKRERERRKSNVLDDMDDQ